MIEKYIQTLRMYTLGQPPNFGDGDSILTLLYEAYIDENRLDNEQIKTNFNVLYEAMNGMTLKEIDTIIYPVCALCREHEKTGFIEGIKVGLRLEQE